MYKIIITPHYYSGTCNAPQEGYVMVDDDRYDQEPREWETEAEAQAWIDEQQAGTYYLSHGEAGSPSYSIVDDDKSTDQDDCFNAGATIGDEYRYETTRVDQEDIPDDILDALQSGDVQYRDSGSDYDIYDLEIDGYYIVFCPRTVAIEDNVDDLGGVDWDHEAYYRTEG